MPAGLRPRTEPGARWRGSRFSTRAGCSDPAPDPAPRAAWHSGMRPAEAGRVRLAEGTAQRPKGGPKWLPEHGAQWAGGGGTGPPTVPVAPSLCCGSPYPPIPPLPHSAGILRPRAKPPGQAGQDLPPSSSQPGWPSGVLQFLGSNMVGGELPRDRVARRHSHPLGRHPLCTGRPWPGGEVAPLSLWLWPPAPTPHHMEAGRPPLVKEAAAKVRGGLHTRPSSSSTRRETEAQALMAGTPRAHGHRCQVGRERSLDSTLPSLPPPGSPPRNVPPPHIPFLSFLPGAETGSDLAEEPRRKLQGCWGLGAGAGLPPLPRAGNTCRPRCDGLRPGGHWSCQACPRPGWGSC
uniref:Uncharacterized protein n=1 Tax=Mustela putorius furo TaxID=9669 RepID=M3Z7Q8_MUSPF